MPSCASAPFVHPLRRLEAALGRRRRRPEERRDEPRDDFGFRFRLTPLDAHGDPLGPAPGEDATYVFGRDISAGGVGFDHDGPIPHRRVQLVAADDRLTDLGLDDLRIDVVLRWCRFVAPGRYESGGRIVRGAALAG